MEEQILKILKQQYVPHGFTLIEIPREQAAKEITDHVMEFIEWLKDECDIRDYYSMAIYDYWLTNIKK